MGRIKGNLARKVKTSLKGKIDLCCRVFPRKVRSEILAAICSES